MDNMTNLKISFALLLLTALSAALVCGCTNSQPAGTPAVSSGDFVNLLEVVASDPVWHTNPDNSCYYTSQIDVKNIGDKDAKNVMIRCHLKDQSGKTVGTKSQYYEVIDAGDHKVFSVSIDGDCNGKYTIIAIATEERP